ncbi:MAG: Asp-tRNA(Asn)/Glu-tRNA(Gln) amidotransferase GatCAB subunit A [Candidatus Levybacteria bacterium CG_4_9_14_3_um_filter_35_16]|nr:MAG: Asp-tRNA(Asn)/Glu-tRNA(Gln) amidotransferase GatCAB subunit A [Candidatus Levybacteria bacterium CG22_combo_CG10-13_8_21_14_all_35_11]PIZ99875.1 MAG: Asp-tRNA(Asn)/Glu-tRNA(Gln) amidotransferase GatCAB subunit A [Candidatus Levybacteria bacterium CG_4_10_14_0_2_um_filter_35_8]PJA91197.1 MAG: Asp-tRNA(Asn)/Glu-tRNA(Gln) amidotransferase GatCAB subunit A [Candidatus Levybacteria bacterium CG_4_9_14_3_um_filter_35_16]PJC54871.1 MAG: Asp-tRNA(Asn)/Glu-tRNA(Gln) amidotransferase GatCAB subuni
MKLNELTIKQAIDGLRKKEFSALDLTESCLDQIARLNPLLNAFLTICNKEAINAAKQADEKLRIGDKSPLLGIPIALKDIYLTKNIRTTASSKVLDNYIPQYDATVVKKLKDAGAIILGKLNCDAWAHGSSGENSDYGPVKNPYNVEYTPGGSSSGSAASVAADMSIASGGTDTGGSIRLPAAFCNVVGLKPTYGRVSRNGIIAMSSSLDSIGHFTKTVEDSALYLNVTAGKDSFDATTPNLPVPDYSKNLNKSIKGTRIGIPKEFFTEGLDKKIKEKTMEAISFFEKQGAEIIDISLPHTDYAIAAYYIIQPAEVSSNLARYDSIRYGNKRSYFGKEAKRRIMLGTFTLSAGYYDAYYKKAMKVRTLIKKDYEEAFKKVDAIITPVSPTLPWKLGEKINDPLKMYLSDIFTVTANLAGIPGLSVPIGIIGPSTSSEQAALPVGMQILGPQFSEELLFNLGHQYEIGNPNKEKPQL